jgi:hypothetical protein
MLVVTDASGSSIRFQGNPVQRPLTRHHGDDPPHHLRPRLTMEQHVRSMPGLDPTSVIV